MDSKYSILLLLFIWIVVYIIFKYKLILHLLVELFSTAKDNDVSTRDDVVLDIIHSPYSQLPRHDTDVIFFVDGNWRFGLFEQDYFKADNLLFSIDEVDYWLYLHYYASDLDAFSNRQKNFL